MLFRRLRRNRWLAALLVLASPAIAGQAIPALHPCPMMGMAMPMMAMGGPMQSMPGQHDQAPGDQSQHHPDCTCIGFCNTAPAVASSTPSITATIVRSPSHDSWPVIEYAARTAAALDLLPESTAPPLV